MAQHFSRPPLPTPPEPFSEAQGSISTNALFWAKLLTYRPLFLLGGLWLAFVCASAIAYHGLFSEPTDSATYAEAPLTVMEAPPQNAPTAPTASPAPAASGHTSPSGTVALWGLLSLVGLCGFGCFVLTQQIKASARPVKRQKPRPRPVAKRPKPVSAPHPKRLAPYSPQRDGVVVPGGRIVEAPGPEAPVRVQPVGSGKLRPGAAASRTGTKPRPQPQPNRPAQPDLSAAGPAPARHPAVVPPEADLALDWSEGSVAHALDVRQRRSLSSFM
ncbi:hypothetical protein [Nodosilinea nodulosa]|uniref:hypothetical protein n=1 Tax=Nodosilinea nodulosa TaxID=416001 RepID=UPI0002D6EE9F|nr:hypothetical protein [Nodosilinea nodulosa]